MENKGEVSITPLKGKLELLRNRTRIAFVESPFRGRGARYWKSVDHGDRKICKNERTPHRELWVMVLTDAEDYDKSEGWENDSISSRKIEALKGLL